MKVVKKNVYYCEFCKKKGLSGGHMQQHEKNCTANPDRYCRACGTESIKEIIEGFKSRFKLEPFMIEDPEGNFVGEDFKVIWTGEPVTLDEVLKSVDHCPNCVFTIIRQCKFNWHYFKDAFAYDYKKDLASYMIEKQQLGSNDW
jgi:hypothetical protein